MIQGAFHRLGIFLILFNTVIVNGQISSSEIQQIALQDSHAVFAYLQAHPLSYEGITLTLSGDVPLLETYLCGRDAFVLGKRFQFVKGRVCSTGVYAFPDKNIIVLEKTSSPVQVSGNWLMVEGDDSFLLYNAESKFPENATEKEVVVNEPHPGMYLDAAGKLTLPRYLYRDGSWKPALPIREYFSLSLGIDDTFTIETTIVRGKAEDQKALQKQLGIQSATLRTELNPDGISSIAGTHFTGAKIPMISFSDAVGDSRGRYLISLKYPRFGKRCDEILEKNGIRVQYSCDGSGCTIDAAVTTKKPAQRDIDEAVQFVRKRLPAYFTRG